MPVDTVFTKRPEASKSEACACASVVLMVTNSFAGFGNTRIDPFTSSIPVWSSIVTVKATGSIYQVTS
jgi:hypothetical protein